MENQCTPHKYKKYTTHWKKKDDSNMLSMYSAIIYHLYWLALDILITVHNVKYGLCYHMSSVLTSFKHIDNTVHNVKYVCCHLLTSFNYIENTVQKTIQEEVIRKYFWYSPIKVKIFITLIPIIALRRCTMELFCIYHLNLLLVKKYH